MHLRGSLRRQPPAERQQESGESWPGACPITTHPADDIAKLLKNFITFCHQCLLRSGMAVSPQQTLVGKSQGALSQTPMPPVPQRRHGVW
jgi:hypothetical protein